MDDVSALPASLLPEGPEEHLYRGLRLRSRVAAQRLLSGRHQSRRLGESVEFAQHRPYTPGDEIRRIDWKVYGRSDRLVVRQHEHSAQLDVLIAVDVSGSMGYAGSPGGMSKLEMACRCGAVLAWLAGRQQDAVGWCGLGAVLQGYWPAQRRAASWKEGLVRTLERGAGGPLDLGACVGELARRVPGRALIVLLSDFLFDVKGLSEAMGLWSARRCEVAAIQVLDPLEIDPSSLGASWLQGLEGEAGGLLWGAEEQTQYRRRLDEHQERLRSVARRFRADWLTLRTDAPMHRSLAGWLAGRGGG